MALIGMKMKKTVSFRLMLMIALHPQFSLVSAQSLPLFKICLPENSWILYLNHVAPFKHSSNIIVCTIWHKNKEFTQVLLPPAVMLCWCSSLSVVLLSLVNQILI